MTKEIILPMNEITDSVEMLHENPNKGMPVFTWILVLLLAAALTWCCIGEIDYFIKASGVVRPGENVSTISTLMTGRVETLNISEGDNVKREIYCLSLTMLSWNSRFLHTKKKNSALKRKMVI